MERDADCTALLVDRDVEFICRRGAGVVMMRLSGQDLSRILSDVMEK